MAKSLNENTGVSITGHVLIKDADSNEILLDKYNAINFENMAYALANLLAGTTNNGTPFNIADLAYGNEGTTVGTDGVITYKAPQVDGLTGSLYSETFSKSVMGNTDPDNSTRVEPKPGQYYSDVVVTSTLGYNETGLESQLPSDNAVSDLDTNYIFDEIGLRTEEGRMLTHLIFHPIQKSANRKLQIIYTLRIRTGS